MTAKRSSEAAALEQMPSVGKAVAKGKDGLNLYHKLYRTTGVRHDPCMADE